MINLSRLPVHGRIDCVLCHRGQPVDFGRTVTDDGEWRITANPLAWGNPYAKYVVLGFSKGPTQAGALASIPHDRIAFKGGRLQLAKILAHIRLIESGDDVVLARTMDRIITEKLGLFHFGSLIRCTVEHRNNGKWTATGADMLNGFVASRFGAEVAGRCTSTFLGNLPTQTKIVVMLGMGRQQKYIVEARKLFERSRPGKWSTINDVAYTDGLITVVHVEHFKSQGPHISNWLSGERHPRGRFGLDARSAVIDALR